MKTKTEENLETLNAYARLMDLPLKFVEDDEDNTSPSRPGTYLRFAKMGDQGSKKFLRILNPIWLERAGPEQIHNLLEEERKYLNTFHSQ